MHGGHSDRPPLKHHVHRLSVVVFFGAGGREIYFFILLELRAINGPEREKKMSVGDILFFLVYLDSDLGFNKSLNDNITE